MQDETDYVMNEHEKDIPEESKITGRTKGPYRSDGTDEDHSAIDNKNRYSQENSANGLDSQQVRGGQDGRNDRAIGSTDMDGANGVLRFNDQDSEAPTDVTEEGQKSVTAADTKTSTVDVTTHGPDDYASAGETPTPKAQKKAKEQDKKSQSGSKSSREAASQRETEENVAQTGTSISHKPTY